MYGPLDQDYWHQYAEDDNWTMRISDDDEYADYDDDDDVYVPHRPNIKRFKREAKPESTERVSYQVSSLTDLSARVVALNVSFGVVERNSPPVPDELRLKILSFSFPEKEELVERWAGFNSSIVHVSEAEEICASADCVKNLIQIGKYFQQRYVNISASNQPLCMQLPVLCVKCIVVTKGTVYCV